MSQSPYVTVREASQIIGVSEGKVMSLVEEKKLLAYRIADQYLRFKRSDVLAMRDSGNIASENVKFPYSAQERLRDILVYNDFYLVSFVIIIVMVGIVFFWK